MSGEQMLICLVGWDCLAQAAAVRLAEIHPVTTGRLLSAKVDTRHSITTRVD